MAGNKKKYPWTFRRIAAWVGIVLLAAMYAVTLVFAVLDIPGADRLFRISLGLTIAVPIILWFLIWMVGYLRHKKTIASFNILNSNPQERQKMEEEIRKKDD